MSNERIDELVLAMEQAAAMLRHGIMAVKITERRRIATLLDAHAAELLNLVEACKPFDALYQPDGPISHWDREGDDRAIFGVNHATITLGDMRRLRTSLVRVQGGQS